MIGIITFPIIIIFFKSKKDIINGISKLDNIIKISVFQKFTKNYQIANSESSNLLT